MPESPASVILPGGPLRILHVASEMAPLVKTGGLADVVGALPKALVAMGADARVAIPGYQRALHSAGLRGMRWLPSAMTIEAGGIDHRVGVGEVVIDGVTVWLLACNELFGRDGIYGPSQAADYDDNTRRFAVFNKAALALAGLTGWQPHIVHAHDWQAGLVAPLLERGFCRTMPATRSVLSIHNLAYQGACWHFDMKLTGLDWSLFNPNQLEHYSKLNLLKAGIVFADRVTTVSRRYASEIQLPEFGYSLDPVVRAHAYKLDGITNGIDTAVWDPATDAHLPHPFSADDLEGKRLCREALRKECELADAPQATLVGVVSRLTEQKGIDLIIDAVSPYILAGRMQLVVLGSGDLHLEHRLHQLQARHPGWVYAWYGHNEPLAHRVIAGCDAFLMPSRFEPCGLTQMYAKRYGTLPVVRYTGGLADTITDVSTGDGDGFTFGPADHGHFSSVLDRCLGLHRHFPDQWVRAMLRGMAADHSWGKVAQEYVRLYREMLVPG